MNKIFIALIFVPLISGCKNIALDGASSDFWRNEELATLNKVLEDKCEDTTQKQYCLELIKEIDRLRYEREASEKKDFPAS